MSWWKIAFCIAGYLFAWAAVAGFYDQAHKNKNDGLDGFGFLIGAAWPMYIAWLPFRAVYNAVRAQMLAQVERAKKAAEPSVPPGKFRLGSCETCAYAVDRTEDYVWCKKNGGAFCKGERCEEYESATEKQKSKKKEELSKWSFKDYASAILLDCLGYKTICKMNSGKVYATSNGKEPFFLPFGYFMEIEPHKNISVQEIIKESKVGRANGLKWRDES